MADSTFFIRKIRKEDNPSVAHIIRTVMTEFGAVGEGYSIMDPEVDDMAGSYSEVNSAYFVIEDEQKQVIGGGGIAHLTDADADICELRKMYFLPEARGHGLGRQMIFKLEKEALELGFRRMYLESIASMEAANHLYRSLGFQALCSNMGNTGHNACGLYYIKNLQDA